jgi:thiamine transport system permease protein
MGASTQQIWWHIYQPLLRPALAIAASFSFLISLGDFGAASFIATGEKATITTTLYRLISRPGGQNYDLALLLSLIFIVVVFAVLYLANRVGSQKQQG